MYLLPSRGAWSFSFKKNEKCKTFSRFFQREKKKKWRRLTNYNPPPPPPPGTITNTRVFYRGGCRGVGRGGGRGYLYQSNSKLVRFYEQWNFDCIPYFVGPPSLSVYDRPTSIPPAICQIFNKIVRNRLHASQMTNLSWSNGILANVPSHVEISFLNSSFSFTPRHVQSKFKNQPSKGPVWPNFGPVIETDEKGHYLAWKSIQDEPPPKAEYQVKCLDCIWLSQYSPMIFPKRQPAPFVLDKSYRGRSKPGICCICVGLLILDNDQIHLLWPDCDIRCGMCSPPFAQISSENIWLWTCSRNHLITSWANS